jgi:hypothetical protein
MPGHGWCWWHRSAVMFWSIHHAAIIVMATAMTVMFMMLSVTLRVLVVLSGIFTSFIVTVFVAFLIRFATVVLMTLSACLRNGK